jgi:hypothetical protein
MPFWHDALNRLLILFKHTNIHRTCARPVPLHSIMDSRLGKEKREKKSFKKQRVIPLP